MYTYGGAGYGWDDPSKNIRDNGPEAELGITFKMKRFVMTVGYTHRIQSRYTYDTSFYSQQHSSYSYNDFSLKWKGLHFGLGYVFED
jgi:hypothetical protein